MTEFFCDGSGGMGGERVFLTLLSGVTGVEYPCSKSPELRLRALSLRRIFSVVFALFFSKRVYSRFCARSFVSRG